MEELSLNQFWTFYQNMDHIEHPFTLFGIAHITYLLITVLVIFLIFRNFKKCDEVGRTKWMRGFAWYFILQELFFYSWTYFSCQENVLFEVLQLELCTFCVFLNFSTLFHQNKQVRFFSALVGFIGGPIALCYPAVVVDIYPVFCYRLIGFYMTHGSYILFALMLLADGELMKKERLVKHLGITAALLTFVYFFDLRFGTQYMFVGTPPEIPFIRALYDVVGDEFFLPCAIIVLSLAQVLMFFVVRKIQKTAWSRTGGRKGAGNEEVQNYSNAGGML